ncbi:LysR substrate-binding domain-containing protein [Spiribacter halobius]|uniref:LysR family transcriptional regulator n=1 Tax=Sediminicurvatus halobius TaxID=2182432 RepID=A0A2U2MXV6_9GAMM|nr:LysR substrate-binding domain-containing protein [Spiribacter halobius]PWG61504.1 LysR family transcriptional regulator [Spiribacter halobius]UEX77957.1 LysR family transcriptional regulator [Spiribacter halobius]
MSKSAVRLPPLDAVRGFVAVGRRMSVTLAAEDLFLTQSAVSRKLRTLEDYLGVELLERGHRSISLTPAGEHFFRVAEQSISQIEAAVAYLGRQKTRAGVTITASIGVSGLWLLPRLGRLQGELPGIDVRVEANNALLDLRAAGIDLAIRYCSGRDAPPGALRLFGECTVPVAHPSLAVDRVDAETLPALTLLEFGDPGRPWLQWSEQLHAASLDRDAPRRVVHFNQYDQVIQAAIAGQGVALGRRALVEPMLADGRLKALAWRGPAASTEHAYWLVQAESEPAAEVIAIRDWILTEARHYNEQDP